MLLDIGLALVSLAAILAVAGRVVRRRSNRRDMEAKFKSEFLDAAHHIVRDERIPDEVAELAMYLAQHVDSSWPLRVITWDLLMNGTKRPRRTKIFEAIEKLPQELQMLFAKTVVLFGVSLTYNNFVLGFLFRRLFWVLTNSTAPKTTMSDSRVQTIARDMADKACAA